MKRIFLLFASLSAASAVILGALGAHALKKSLSPKALESFHTGVDYQLYHALALLVVAGLFLKDKKKLTQAAALLFMIGPVLFSGSIYLLSTQAISGADFSWLGPITPLGGLLMISGWFCLSLSFLKSKERL